MDGWVRRLRVVVYRPWEETGVLGTGDAHSEMEGVPVRVPTDGPGTEGFSLCLEREMSVYGCMPGPVEPAELDYPIFGFTSPGPVGP